MNILLVAIIALIAVGHTVSAFCDGIICRVLTYVTIALHPAALVPMLLLDLPLEAVAMLFLLSALYYTLISLIAGCFNKRRAPLDRGGDEN